MPCTGKSLCSYKARLNIETRIPKDELGLVLVPEIPYDVRSHVSFSCLLWIDDGIIARRIHDCCLDDGESIGKIRAKDHPYSKQLQALWSLTIYNVQSSEVKTIVS